MGINNQQLLSNLQYPTHGIINRGTTPLSILIPKPMRFWPANFETRLGFEPIHWALPYPPSPTLPDLHDVQAVTE
jgi:hypothetical protein